MAFKAGQTIRFTYHHSILDKDSGDRFKEVFVLNPIFNGKLHAIDLKRLTDAEREVLRAIFDPKTKLKRHHLPLVNDILKRMNPVEEAKNPFSFYHKFVKVFLRNKDAYRTYSILRMLNTTIVTDTHVYGGVNPNPLFYQIGKKAKKWGDVVLGKMRQKLK